MYTCICISIYYNFLAFDGPNQFFLFFRLPLHSPELLEKWLKALRIDNWTPTKYFNVCSRHFREDNYRKSLTGVSLTNLHYTIPSVFQDKAKHKKCSFNTKLVLNL